MICTLAPLERALQLHIVVAGHAKRLPRRHHAPHEIDDADDIRPAIHQIAEEDRLAPVGMAHAQPRRPAGSRAGPAVPQLVVAAMNVADDVEGAGLASCGWTTAARARCGRRPSPPASAGSKTWRKPSRSSPRRPRRSSRTWLRTTCGAELPVGARARCAPRRSARPGSARSPRAARHARGRCAPAARGPAA